MKFLICMPTGKDGIQDDAVIRDALLTAVNRITLTDTIYQKRNWNELAKFTAEWDEKRLLEEANKHMAELQNDVVA